jgi:hypothetical protein
VNIKIASSDVHLNGVFIQNAVSQYPLIVYNEITYFPMTYSDSRFLGIATKWTAKEGLSVEKGGIGEYQVYDTYINDLQGAYKARVITDPIKLNGTDRTGGKYPFLSFRNVAYFPLTWEYAANEFGWKYSWSKDMGLSIRSREYANAERETVLNAINRTAFSDGYQFTYHLDRENREALSTTGTMRSAFRTYGGEERCTYYSSFDLQSPLLYEENQDATGWGHEYVCDGATLSTLSISASYPPGFSGHPFLENALPILGDMRKAVENVERVQEKVYEITFRSDTAWANRKTAVTMDGKNNVKQVVIKDRDYQGEYTLHIELSVLLH